MPEFFDDPYVKGILLIAGLAAVIAVGVYLIGLARRYFREEGVSSHQMLSNFRDLHAQGELDDEEFKTIKNALGSRIKDELKRDGKDG